MLHESKNEHEQANPQNITLRSNFGGEATRTVTVR
jgi:hypothetical protein